MAGRVRRADFQQGGGVGVSGGRFDRKCQDGENEK
jgi:hypothetical protein